MIFAYNHGPSKKINRELIDVFDQKISTTKAKLAKQENDVPTVRFIEKAEQHPDIVKIKPVVKETEESALKVNEKKAIPVEETVDNEETLCVRSHYVNDAFDDLCEHPVAELYSSFQKELQDETVDTAVEEQEVSPDDDSEHDVSFSDQDNELVKIEQTFDFEKIIDEEQTDPKTESVDQDDVPPDDDSRPDVGKDLVKGDKILDFDSEDLESATLDDRWRFSMSMKLTPLNLPMIFTSLLTTQLSSLNTKPDIKQKENCVDKKETDALQDEVAAATRKTDRFPYDPGKSLDTINDVEAATVDVDAGKTTPGVPNEDSDVYECSGSRSLIDDLLFQHVAPQCRLMFARVAHNSSIFSHSTRTASYDLQTSSQPLLCEQRN